MQAREVDHRDGTSTSVSGTGLLDLGLALEEIGNCVILSQLHDGAIVLLHIRMLCNCHHDERNKILHCTLHYSNCNGSSTK